MPRKKKAHKKGPAPTMRNIKNVLISGTVIRVIVSVLSNTLFFNELMQCHSLKSILIDPLYSMSHFRESCHLSRLYMEGLFSVSSNSANAAFTLKPVLLLALIDRLLEMISRIISLNVFFALMTIFIDLVTTIQLYRLMVIAINTTNVDKQWEQKIEQFMNPRIHPTFAWVFGEKFGTRFVPKKTDDPTTIYENLSKSDLSRMESLRLKQAIWNITDVPQLCCIIYYLNPISILTTSIYPSFQGLQYLLLVSMFQQLMSSSTCEKNNNEMLSNVLKSTIILSLLTCFETHYIVFLPPLIWQIRQLRRKDSDQLIQYCIASYILGYAVINVLLFLLSASDDFSSAMFQLKIGRDHDILTPNIGMQWYLFMNLFGRCRQFFVVATKGFPYLLCIPFSIRFHRYPLALVTMTHLFSALLKQTPTLHDMSFGLALLFLEPRSLMRIRKVSILAIWAMPVTIALYVVDYWLWLESGAGNPNFLYFQCLAYTLFLTTVASEFVSATARRDKALRLTERGQIKKVKVS